VRLPKAMELVGVLREIRLDDIRAEAEHDPLIVVAGSLQADAYEVFSALDGDGYGGGIIRLAKGDLSSGPNRELLRRADLVIYVWNERVHIAESEQYLARDLAVADQRLLIVRIKHPGEAILGDDSLLPARLNSVRTISLFPPEGGIWNRRLFGEGAKTLETRQLAMARCLPHFREVVSDQLIFKTSRANAEFALLSSIPTFVPVVGSFVSAGADFLVLTKNQLVLLYKLAAVHGRDLDSKVQIYGEMLPVVGTGLVWRTIARELMALLPDAIGVVPKTTIAYAGTFAIGKAAEYYYANDMKPHKEIFQMFYRQALEQAKSMPVLSRKPKEAPALDVPAAGSRRRILSLPGR
jgi:uncharacterized protein (DUF697 family)